MKTIIYNYPLVSVIIASLNGEKFIGEAIDSVINQTYKNVEILVADGGSTDKTVKILKNYGSMIKWFSGTDNGEADAYNKALKIVKGDIINFLPSDDLLYPYAVKTAVKAFSEIDDDKVGMIVGDGFVLDEESHIIGFRKSQELNVECLINIRPGVITMPATFIKKKAICEVGGWDTNIWYACDLDLWVRILEKYKCVYIQKPLSCWRQHSNSLSVSKFFPALLDCHKVRRRHGGKLICGATYRSIRAVLGTFSPALNDFFFDLYYKSFEQCMNYF